jgi:hypothetical protein
MSVTTNPVVFPGRDMNYGVELEFLFAFHEDELSVRGDQIKKYLDYATREQYPEFTPTTLPNHVYNSWGIVDDDASKPRAVSNILTSLFFRYANHLSTMASHKQFCSRISTSDALRSPQRSSAQYMVRRRHWRISNTTSG